MSSKIKTEYICSECGFKTLRWYGKCPECSAWNTLSESVKREEKTVSNVNHLANIEGLVKKIDSLDINSGEMRSNTGIKELDRVLGGGIVSGSVVLLSGEPGIGKSTLLLQMCKAMCLDRKILYIAGEESPKQIKMRAHRLGLTDESLYIADITDIETVVYVIEKVNPDLVMIDSIQTMNLKALSAVSGSLTQVRECTQLLLHCAKSLDIPVFIVGHVNKDGAIAGPKVLEHMVDCVVYFEGDRHSSYRLLRAVKNRYGSTNEIGMFEMSGEGLVEVQNPSMLLLSGRPAGVSGTCVACVMEGTRPILAEVQALVSKTAFGTPRRTATGFDYNRMALLVAVLEKRAGYFFGNLDAYINVTGGLRLDEPAADLPVALSLVSNLLDKPVDDTVCAIGEIGLAGEVRWVNHVNSRIQECIRLGFKKIIIPFSSYKNINDTGEVQILPVKNISEAFKVFK